MPSDPLECPVCFHPHRDYDDEPCVSCGCDAVFLQNAKDRGDEWVRRLVASWLRDPEFKAALEALGDD